MDASFFNFKRYDIAESADSDMIVHSGNPNGTMIIVTDDHVKEEACGALLNGIREAIHSTSENTLLITVESGSKLRLAELQGFAEATHLIMLGVNSKQVGLNIEQSSSKVNHFGNKKMVFSSSLKVLNEDFASKREFWEILKTGFILG